MTLQILYEDNHILALWKESGISTQPTPYLQPNLEDFAKNFIRERDQKKGGVFLHAVHRLDKDTSGIVVFAKTQKALSRLMESFRENHVVKEYLALVQGSPPLGLYTDFLVHDDQKARVVPERTALAKKASLTLTSATPFTEHAPFFSKVKLPNIFLLHIHLHTGRYHQIRAQLAKRGFPILGDAKYGSKIPYEHGIALVHFKLTIPHPTLKIDLTIQERKGNY